MCPARAASTRRSSRTRHSRPLALVLALGLCACHATPPPTIVAAPPRFDSVVGLRQDIDAILAAPALERSQWGVVVHSLKTGERLYSRNGGKLLMPGSTMKLVTLAAAAERLGWNYAFETRVIVTGPIVSGVIEGDLVAVGSGDPSIVDPEGASIFTTLSNTLKAAGVHSIAGRVIGDDNAFDDDPYGPGWAWDDLAGRDSAAISGLQYNENIVQLSVSAGPAIGSPATVAFAPASAGLELENHVRTSAADLAPALTVRRFPGDGRVQLAGSVPLGSTPISRLVAVANPTLFFASALRDGLIAGGIGVEGAAADFDDVVNPPVVEDGTLLWLHRSPPLSTLAMRLMKDSQNLYAESLFKAIGGRTGTPTFEGGRTVAAETVLPWGVSPTGLIQVDGSGVSRYNYLTADTLVAVLTHVNGDEQSRVPFEAALPIAGQDGTLAFRMKGTAADGKARAKSGTLANVRSLAGFVTSADGERLVFAIIANNYGTMPEVAIAAIDAIVIELAEFAR